jgi:S-DNA-T family DNA segregation ATPase FtsK/SpoIIIE
MEHTPEDVNLYLVDFGGGLLTTLAPLPSVGDVVVPEEGEKLDCLLHFLVRELHVRARHFAHVDANTLSAYRTKTGRAMPAIIVVLDDYDAFASVCSGVVDQLTLLVREGGNFGIHVVLSAAAPSSLGAQIRNSVNLTVALQLTDPAEYGVAVGNPGGLRLPSIPGRGLVKGTPPFEFQAALPVQGSTQTRCKATLQALVGQISRAWPESNARASPIPVCSAEETEQGTPTG